MKIYIFFTFIIVLTIGVHAQDSIAIDQTFTNDSIARMSGTFDEPTYSKAMADSAYMDNEYSTAIEIYESLLEKGESAEIYYNLGNSYYKSNDIARAILNYERALLLNPGNDDIRANLEIARSKTVDRVEEVPDIFFIGWIKSLINSSSVDIWAKWGIAFFFLFLTGLYFFIFSTRVIWKKIGFISAVGFLLLVLITNIFASTQKSTLVNRNTAIIITPSVTVRSTPNESGTSLFILHEGRKVNLKDNSMKNWKEISLEDGKIGWVRASDIEVI